MRTHLLFRLLAALELYRSELDVLVRSAFSLSTTARLGRALSRVARLSQAVPNLAADLAGIALHHNQLMATLIQHTTAATPGVIDQLQSLAASNEAAVCAVRDKCTDLLTA